LHFFCSLCGAVGFFFNPGDFEFLFLASFLLTQQPPKKDCMFFFLNFELGGSTSGLKLISDPLSQPALQQLQSLGVDDTNERHGVFFLEMRGGCEIKMGKKSSKVDSFSRFFCA